MFGFFKKGRKSEDQEDKIASLAPDDAPLLTFKNQAQDELQYLIDFINDHDKDDELFRYAVKTNFIENDNAEHMWVQVNEFNSGYFSGRLANEPNTLKALKYGDQVKVKREDVEDWILEDFLTKTKVGGFSSNYLRNKAN